MRIINIANGNRIPLVWTEEFTQALREVGELTLAENGVALSDEEFAEQIRAHEMKGILTQESQREKHETIRCLLTHIRSITLKLNQHG